LKKLSLQLLKLHINCYDDQDDDDNQDDDNDTNDESDSNNKR